MGITGSDRSTIFNLLTRLYDVTDGVVRIDGTDVRDLDLHDLRAKVGYVPQQAYLFSETVADNIRFGRPEATLEEVIAAAKAANIHEAITAPPKGYDTVPSECGASFSQGQRQLIVIAYRLNTVQNADQIVVLDKGQGLEPGYTRSAAGARGAHMRRYLDGRRSRMRLQT